MYKLFEYINITSTEMQTKLNNIKQIIKKQKIK